MKQDNPFERSLSGLEVKDWIWCQIHNKTKYAALARSMGSFFNLDNEKFYILKLCNGDPIASEVPEKGKKYKIPCND